MKVSILIITYNHESYISDAIKGVLMQQNSLETEIILLDDSSTDQTFELASSQLHHLPNVTLIKNEKNLGITKNYQKGFSLCSGEFLFVLEGDDYWIDSLKVQSQVEFLERYPFHSMCFHPFIIRKGHSSLFTSFLIEKELPPGFLEPFKSSANYNFYSFTISDLILIEGLIGGFSVCCYRKKCIDRLPKELFDVLSYDWIINLFMAHFGLLGRLNTVMGVYRFADNATWSKKTDEERTSDIMGLIPIYDKLLDYQYTSLFSDKLASLKLQNGPQAKTSLTADFINRWVPPVIVKGIKLVIPPGAAHKLRKFRG